MNSASIVKKSRSNFSWAFWGLEKRQREGLEALYAFCRTVDDIVDQAKNPAVARDELDRWRSILDRISRPSVFDPQVAKDLSEALVRFPIHVEDLRWIVDGVEMDLSKKRYATFEELLSYCDGVASAVGLASMAIFGGDRKETAVYAFATGRALQLTNILRDVVADAKMDRIYLPQSDLERFGYGERELLRSQYNERFVALMRFQKERAETFYVEAAKALSAKERRRYPAAELMRRLYWALLRRIESRQYRMFGARVSVPKLRKLCIASSIWFPHLFCKGW
ncbi:MAG: squalene/phytoene synthase family protein [Pseudomonadota bacterium]